LLRRAIDEARRVIQGAGSTDDTASSVGAWSKRFRVFRHYQRIDEEYVLEPYGWPVDLIWPESDPETPETAIRSWRQISGTIRLSVIPGTHRTCRLEFADAYATALVRALSQPVMPSAVDEEADLVEP
jgi:surfactin synthase thioesterase subunit